MKKIVCELCEGVNFVKADGMFTCQGCGTQYTLEQAKSMMIEVDGDAPSVVPVASAPIGNYNQQQIDNLLLLASNAYESGNIKETESYCNKAIELDAMCYKAWNLKGKAIGWQSSIGNIRIEEAAHSFCKAIDFAPEEEKSELTEEASDEIKRLGLALISLRKKHFISDPSESELNGFKSDKNTVLAAVLIMLKHGNIVGIPDGYLEEVATLMNEAGVAAINTIRGAWKQVKYPSYSDWKTYIGWFSNVETLFRMAIDTSDNDDEADIVRYKNLIITLNEPISSCSYKQIWNSYSSRYEYVKEYSLADSAIASRKKEIAECEAVIRKLEAAAKQKKVDEAKKAAEEKQARIDAYWAEHSEEKEALEKEKNDLVLKKSELSKKSGELDKEIELIEGEASTSTPSEDEKKKVQSQIDDLRTKKSGLGIFAGKEKKQIDEEISALEGRMITLEKKIQEEKSDVSKSIVSRKYPLVEQKKPIDDEINSIIKRISEIDDRFKEDPGEE